jgi:hypothetical protein
MIFIGSVAREEEEGGRHTREADLAGDSEGEEPTNLQRALN